MKLKIDNQITVTMDKSDFYRYFVTNKHTVFNKRNWVNEITILRK